MFCLRPCLIRQSNGKLIYADQYCLQTWKLLVGVWTLGVMALVINSWSSLSRWRVNMQPVNMHGAAKIKTFFSRSGRELPKLLIIFIYGGFTTRSCPCFLLFIWSHPNAALMRIIGLFENIGGGGENNCSHNLLQTLTLPEPAHLQSCFPSIKLF